MSEKKIELTKSEQIGDTREHIADLVNASVSVLKEENKNALLKLLETHHESDIAEMIALLNGGSVNSFSRSLVKILPLACWQSLMTILRHGLLNG